MAFNGITRGLIKAVGLIANFNTFKNTKRQARYTYEDLGKVLHAKHCVTQEQRDLIKGLVDSFAVAETPEVRKAIMDELHRQPIKFVPIKRAHLVPRGKTYPSGGGAKERARAALRARGITLLAAE